MYSFACCMSAFSCSSVQKEINQHSSDRIIINWTETSSCQTQNFVPRRLRLIPPLVHGNEWYSISKVINQVIQIFEASHEFPISFLPTFCSCDSPVLFFYDRISISLIRIGHVALYDFCHLIGTVNSKKQINTQERRMSETRLFFS